MAQTFLQIVNATSVPMISLGRDGQALYPKFGQGEMTGYAPTSSLHVTYQAKNLGTGVEAESGRVEYTPNAHQTLVILGDFSTDVAPDQFPQPGPLPSKPQKPFPPNVHFRIYSHALEPAKRPLRVRIVNGMPGKMLTFFPSFTAPALKIPPGRDEALFGQPKPAHYEAEIEGEKYPMTLVQTASENQLVIFYLQEGRPAYLIVSEKTEP